MTLFLSWQEPLYLPLLLTPLALPMMIPRLTLVLVPNQITSLISAVVLSTERKSFPLILLNGTMTKLVVELLLWANSDSGTLSTSLSRILRGLVATRRHRMTQMILTRDVLEGLISLVPLVLLHAMTRLLVDLVIHALLILGLCTRRPLLL
jgi:Mg2+/Co2+ transporter CorB